MPPVTHQDPWVFLNLLILVYGAPFILYGIAWKRGGAEGFNRRNWIALPAFFIFMFGLGFVVRAVGLADHLPHLLYALFVLVLYSWLVTDAKRLQLRDQARSRSEGDDNMRTPD